MAYVIALIAFLIWSGGVGYKAYEIGRDSEIAAAAKAEKMINDTREQARLGSADAIAKIEIKQTTINNRLQKEVQTSTVYRDCINTPDGLRALNDALTNTITGPGGDSKLPAPPPAR